MVKPLPAERTLLGRITPSQDHVVGRDQLLEHGVSHYRLRRRIENGDWQPIGPRAVVLHSGPLTERQWWWCAYFNAGPRGLLAGLTAARAEGLKGFPEAPIHILVPKGAIKPALPGIKIHECRRFDDVRVHPNATPPRTAMDESLVDAALWEANPRRAVAVLSAGVQQGLTLADRLRGVMQGHRWHRHYRMFLSVLDDIEGGSHALTEIDFIGLCRRFGLPEPSRQARRKDANGRNRYLDALWDSYHLAVEIDGCPHFEVANAWADMRRHNALVLDNDYLVLRFPSVALHLDATQVMDQIRLGMEKGRRRRAAA